MVVHFKNWKFALDRLASRRKDVRDVPGKAFIVFSAMALLVATGCAALIGANFDDGPTPAQDGGSAPERAVPQITETNDVTSPNASGTCDAPRKLCDGLCAKTSDPRFGCTETSCEPCSLSYALAACTGGACAIEACRDGRADCNGSAVDGCEVKTGTDPEHCGGCGKRCAPDQVCGPNGCSKTCPQGTTACDRACVDIGVDEQHCGQCGRRCPAPANGTATCAAAQCGIACNAGYHACSGQCVPENAASCGPSCISCAAPAHARATCAGSTCDFSCNAGYARCGTQCCASGPKLVLFGGWVGNHAADTWEWDGSSWAERNVLGPPGRDRHGMAALGVNTVLFGGSNGNYLDDTWVWDGSAWTQRSVSGPPGRWDPMMSTFGTKVVLFGGNDGRGYLGDTWEWDGSSWSQRNVVGPPGRTNGAMATLGTKVVLFGGYDGRGYLGDTWEWDGSSWARRNVNGPPGRHAHAMATLGTKVVMFGGYNGSSLADTWEWDGTAWTSRVVNGPPARGAHAMVKFGGKIVLFGGDVVNVPQDDTWEWDGASWSQRNANGPPARSNLSMTAP